MSGPLAIAVDGPGSAGKGTVARGVARALDYQYVDTGAMYRAVAWMAKKKGIDWNDASGLDVLARSLQFRFSFEGEVQRVHVNGLDLTTDIRDDAIGMGASTVSKHPSVRNALLDLQRGLGAAGGVVMDGRDIGTVVLPDAGLKIYLDANLSVRALRRHEELVRRGTPIPLSDVQESLALRDRQDMERDVAPLKPADDAVQLDTSDMSISAAIRTVLKLAHERGA